MDIKALQARLHNFAEARAWTIFHTPKNLSMALVVEAAELAEIFQWMTPEESISITHNPPAFRAVREELADVLIYSIRLAAILNIDLEKAIEDKMEINAKKYPAEH